MSTINSMMKKYLSIFFFLVGGTLFSQTSKTLEQCIEIAIQNQESLKNASLDQKLSDQKVKQSYTQLYPQVKGIVDVKDNLLLPTNILPGTLLGRPADQTIAVQFGQQYNATAAMDANWVLYDPSVLAGIKSLKQNSMVNQENQELQKKNIRYNVSKSYYGAILAQERIRLQEDLLKKYQVALSDAQVLFSNAQVTKLDLQRAEWNVKNQEAEIQKARQAFEQSIFMLNYQMGYSDSTFVLNDAIMKNATDVSSATTLNGVESRSEYKIIRIQLAQEKLNARRYKMSYLPSLNAYGYLGTQSFRPDFDFFSSSAKWYGVSYVGIKLSVPVFDGMLKTRQVQESRILEEKKTNELSAFEKQYTFETENAKRGISNALQMLEIRKNNLEFSREQYKNTEVRYQQGLVALKEVGDVSAMVSEAQNLYLAAYHDFLVANLEFERIK